MKKLSLIFAIAIIFALGTFTLRSMLAESPASNPSVSSPAPSVSAATNVARPSLPSQTPAAGKRVAPVGVLPTVGSSIVGGKPPASGALTVAANYGKLPLSFEANHGQTDPQVKFLSRGHGYSLFLTGDEAVLALRSQKSEVSSQPGSADLLSKVRGFSRPDAQEPPTSEKRGLRYPLFPPLIQNPLAPSPQPPAPAVLRLKLVGANPAAKVSGTDELPGRSNYFIGNDRKQWRTNVPNYAKVKYQGVYPGVDLVYYGNQQQLEYDFIVAPGGDPRVIALEVGADGVRPAKGERRSPLQIDPNGDLVIATDDGEVRFHKPVVYQPTGASPGSANSEFRIHNSELITGRYLLLADNRVGFEVGAYDKTQPLIIDPVLSYSTYLGGNNQENAYGIAVDSAGNAYVVGATNSTNFPTTSGAFQPNYGGGADAFVTKLNADGSALVYSTYMGGGGADSGYGIAVDASGNAYITGYTYGSFPTTAGAFQTSFGGYIDAFVAKLNADGSALVYSTYLGGSNYDGAYSIAVDASGNAYVAGYTWSSSNFPTTTGAFQTSFGGSHYDAFVTKVNVAGSALVYSTYLGGSNYDGAYSIAVDAAGAAYVTGETGSTDFPTTPGAFQTSYGGGTYDVFVTKLNAAGSALVYSTYLGGSQHDEAFGSAVDASGNTYVTGYTGSGDFPTTPEAFQTSPGVGGDAFVTKLNVAGSALVYSTYLGGDNPEWTNGIAVDATGNAYVTGFTVSSDFPTTPETIQTSYGGGNSDAFVTKFNADGKTLAYSTYLGGGNYEVANGIALDGAGNAYVTGYTGSSDFFTTSGAFQTSYGGGNSDAFVAKIQPRLDISVSPSSLDFGRQSVANLSSAHPLSVTNTGEATLNFTSFAVSGDFALDAGTTTCAVATPLAVGNNCSIGVTFTPTATGTRTGALTITVNAPGSPHSVALTGIGTGFSISASSSSKTVTAGQAAEYTLTIAPVSGFNQTTSLSCSGAPTAATCSVTPSSVTPDGTNNATATVRVTTTARSIAPPSVPLAPPGLGLRLPTLFLLMLAMLGFMALAVGHQRARFRLAVAFAALVLVSALVACGGGGGGGGGYTPPAGTPAGTYTLTITATSGSLSHNTTVSLTVN